MRTDQLVIISFIILGEILLAIVIMRAIQHRLDEPDEISDETQKTIYTLEFLIRILSRVAVGVGLLTVLLILIMLVLIK